MAKQARRIRLTDAQAEWIARHAAEAGESFSEYVATAALARAWMDEARLHPETVVGSETVYEAAARMLGDVRP